MEDDDEFGDLYTDVLRSLEVKFQPQRHHDTAATAARKPPPPQACPSDLNIDSDDEETLYGASDSKMKSNLNHGSAPVCNSNASIRDETLPRLKGIDLNLASNSGAGRIDGLGGKGFEVRVLEKERGLELGGKASDKLNLNFMEDEDDIDIIVEGREDRGEDLVENDDNLTSKDNKMNAPAVHEESTMSLVNDAVAGEIGPQQMIPGLSGRLENSGAPNIEDEWESEDSDDDLQIVLNDNNHGPMGMERLPGMIDEDDEDGEPLVIVADNGDVGHNHKPAQRMTDEQEWGGKEGASRADGEKDTGDAGKAIGGIVGVAPTAVQPKIAYSNHAFHHPFASQFKYVRPGAAPLPPGGIPGQVHPPISMGPPPAGRGRGDWRPAGIKGALPMQKGFHPGYGTPSWGGNAAGRGFGSGLDFTLPSHKTIFEVDIDSFEEKPWKLPGIDVSDFFNFGLNEDSLRDYCKQLEQLRLEMTMQSKIRVYESGRAEQDYDPDLPPELAAAVGIQDNNPSQNSNHGKVDAGQTDLQRAAAREWPPHGKPIPVEAGSGDRLPSIDTRRPRMHDIDAIIEIVCHGSVDGDDTSEQQDNDPAREDDLGGGGKADGLQQGDVDNMDSYSPAYNGNKREFQSRKPHSKNTVNNDGIAREDVSRLPSEVAHNSHPDREIGAMQEERSTKARRNGRSPVIPGRENKREPIAGDLKEGSYRTGDDKRSPVSSSSHSIGPDSMRAAVVGDEMNDGTVVDRCLNTERDEVGLDASNGGAHEDENLHSTKKQKLSSHLGQHPQDYEDGKDSKAARSNDSKARSGSGEHLQSSRDDVGDEVLQNRYPHGVVGSIRRDAGDDDNARRKDHYDRDEAGRQNTVVKGREDSLSRRSADGNLSLHRHGKAESSDWRKDSDVSEGTWNRRDDDHHGRRTRLEDPRKREHDREINSISRDKLREKEKSEKDEHHLSRNKLDNGSWRGANHENDAVGPRQRESRSERVDSLHSTRRKEETHMRRTHAEKDDISHNHRESSIRRKRERDDGSDQLKRDDQGRSKDDELHYGRQKDGGSSQRERSERSRERDEWHKIKQDDLLLKRERVESRPPVRSGRVADEKTWMIHSRGNDDYKGSSREYHPKDINRPSDQLKQRDRVENESFTQRRSHEDVKRTRYEKSSSRNDRAAYGSDTSRTHENKRKESSRKGKESDGGDHSSLIPSKRNQDEDGGPISEMANLRGKSEQHSGRGNHQSSRKHKEEASTDDEQPDSRRGRSKLERWTSQKERDFAVTPTPSSLKKRDGDTDNSSGASLVTVPVEDPSKKMQYKPQPSVDNKYNGPEMNNDNNSKAVEDKHLDTVARLKKRSERFKLPMPSEKDGVAVKKMESEPSPLGQPETPPDSEIKSERPARKRRWTGN